MACRRPYDNDASCGMEQSERVVLSARRTLRCRVAENSLNRRLKHAPGAPRGRRLCPEVWSHQVMAMRSIPRGRWGGRACGRSQVRLLGLRARCSRVPGARTTCGLLRARASIRCLDIGIEVEPRANRSQVNEAATRLGGAESRCSNSNRWPLLSSGDRVNDRRRDGTDCGAA